MDLSVLKGDDPAGYRAEQQIRQAKRAEWEVKIEDRSRLRNPGSIAAADSGQFHVYRRTRRRELERMELFERQRQKEEANEDFEKCQRARKEVLEAKVAKRRERRQKKKLKKEENAKTSVSPTPTDSNKGGRL